MRNYRVLSLVLAVCVIVLPLVGCAAMGPLHTDTADSARGKLRKEQDWSRVARLKEASTITVVGETGRPASRTFVAADESELITLNLAEMTLPRSVRRTLRDLASDRPLDLLRTSRGQTLTDGAVRLDRDGIFLDGHRIAALDRVLERAARNSVTEVRRTHRATERGLMWGLLIGGGLGVAATFAHCGTDWSQETSSCTNLTPLLVFAGPAYGAMIGGAVGATFKISTVVYTTR